MRARLVCTILALACISSANAADARVIRVFPADAPNAVGNAVASAADGDTIVVAPGHYPEFGIEVDTRLTILGNDGAVIDAGHDGEIMRVTADGTVVRGLTFANIGTSFMEDRAAIRLANAKGCEITDNLLLDAFFGIYCENADSSLIARNVIRGEAKREATSGNGIHLWYCRRIDIANNTVEGHRDGIYLEFVEDSRIHGNTSRNNLRYGLHFMFSNGDRYEWNTFTGNGAGVAVMYSYNVDMLNNRFERNWGENAYGLLLKEIRDSRIRANVFSRNTTALYAEGSNRLELVNNRFEQNGYGVKIMANSMQNTFTGNTFTGNTFDVATNSRQNFSTFDGNYWSEYNGYDLDRDGIGDVPHHPVRLFALLVEREPAGVIVMGSVFVNMIDTAERVMPVFTPETLADRRPLMSPPSPPAASREMNP